MRAPPFDLRPNARLSVRATVYETARVRGWVIHEAYVGARHVHLVVSATEPPERVMGSFKAWATRRLREQGLCARDRRPWARHGSTRYLWTDDSLARACRYVREQ